MTTQKSLFTLFLNTPAKNRDKKILWDDNFVITQTPAEWFILRNRKIWGCAHYSLKAVIEWKKKTTRPIEEYSSDWWSRNTYLMTPWWIKRVLKKYNLKYEVLRVRKLDEDWKLKLLKENLKKWPIILLVANWQTKRKWFILWKALTHWHYITLRWYDDKNQIFYVYDSNTKRKTQQYVMKWTLKVPYKYILKERWIGASKLIYNYAIAVKY